MGQTIFSGLAIYFVLWWIVLFAVLPFGVRSPSESGDARTNGTDPGAPVMARMASKLLWTTIVSAVLFGLATFAYARGYVSIERLSRLMGFPF